MVKEQGVTPSIQEKEIIERATEASRYREPKGWLRYFANIISCAGLLVSIIGIFHIRIGQYILISYAYYGLLMALFFPLVFLAFPMRKKDPRNGIPWYDILFAAITFAIGFYYFINAFNILNEGWELMPPLGGQICSILFSILVLEGARRVGGLVFFFMLLFLGLYPLFAESAPRLLQGKQFGFWRIISMINFGSEGFLGIPMRVTGDLIIGFLVFAIVLVYSGGGKFFLDLAFALLGRFRGGPAKVAVIASGFFGSMSGSVISNVITTGSITIPAMKKIGYKPSMAGAVEACASTGGTIMPPVMGVVAFVMAEFMGVPYYTIVIASFVPAVLYYLGILFQVDAYAARNGLKGIPRAEIPSLKQTLKKGWFFLITIIFLTWGLIYMRWEAQTPWYATILLVLMAMLTKETRLNLQGIVNLVAAVARLVAEVMCLVLGIGFIMSGLSTTGMAGSLTWGIMDLAGDSAALILILGFFTSYLLGMGLSSVPCYILLSVIMVPPLTKMGYNAYAVNLFVLYCGMLSFFTPPVALGVVPAAGLANAPFLSVGLQAMRMGIVSYFIPFFFVIEPAFILQGPIFDILLRVSMAVLGIYIIAGGVEGYLPVLGTLRIFSCLIVTISGFCLAYPDWRLTIIGAGLLFLFIFAILIWRFLARRRSEI